MSRISSSVVFCLRDAGGSAILVDTGFTEEAMRQRGLAITDFRSPDELLGRIAVTPSAVRTVLLTHLHWDHFSACRLYPGATFYVQRRDIDYFTGPFMRFPAVSRFVSNVDDLERLRSEGRLKVLDGDGPLLAGIEAVLFGGHTPGSQGFLVNVAGGRVLVCGDACNLYCNVIEGIPPGIVTDLREALLGIERIRAAEGGGCLVIPGHEPRILSDGTPVAPGVVQVA